MTGRTTPPTSEENPAAGIRPGVIRTFGEPRLHADGDILAMAFAPDGSIWSIEDPGVLRQWGPATGEPLRRHFLSDIETIWAFSDDASLVASASDDLSIWKASSGRRLGTIPQPSWVTVVAFRPGSQLLATGHDDGKVRLWDVQSRKLLRELTGHGLPVSALAFHRDGTRLASAGEDRVIHLWEVETGRLAGSLKGHTDRIPALAWEPTGDRLVSAGWDTTARVWNTTTDLPEILLNSHADQVNVVAFSPDGKLLACADSANTVHVWQTTTWKTLHILNDGGEETRCLAFSPDGGQLASGGAERVIHLWDPARGALISGRNATARHSICCLPVPDGLRLASSCGGTALRVWDVATGKTVVDDETPGILAVDGSRDGRWLLAGDSSARVHVWDATTGQPVFSLFGQRGAASSLALAPDARVVAAASAVDGTVWLWKLTDGEPALLVVEAADGCMVESVAFHPNGQLLACGGIDWLATGGSDGAICIWDIKQPKKTAVLDRGTTSLSFHPSGKWLAGSSLDEEVCIWDGETFELIAELTGHKDGVNCVAYSPDGNWLASGGDDRMLRLWNATTREPMALQELDTPVRAVCFSPDGRFLFTSNGNTTCYQLDVARLLEE